MANMLSQQKLFETTGVLTIITVLGQIGVGPSFQFLLVPFHFNQSKFHSYMSMTCPGEDYVV